MKERRKEESIPINDFRWWDHLLILPVKIRLTPRSAGNVHFASTFPFTFRYLGAIWTPEKVNEINDPIDHAPKSNQIQCDHASPLNYQLPPNPLAPIPTGNRENNEELVFHFIPLWFYRKVDDWLSYCILTIAGINAKSKCKYAQWCVHQFIKYHQQIALRLCKKHVID